MEIENLIPVTINAVGTQCHKSCRFLRRDHGYSCDLYHLPLKIPTFGSDPMRTPDCLNEFGGAGDQ